MITTNRCLLSTRNKRILTTLAKFEGIAVIRDASEIETVWKRNKIPVIFNNVIGDFEVPDFDEDDFEKQFTIWSHSNGFEPGEISSGKTFNSSKDSCIFCAIGSYKGGTSSSFVYNATVEKEVDCILYETKNFFVTSELGALKRGFLMICPKNHILSVAQFSKELYNEYQEVCSDIEQILISTFGPKPVAFFEHGSGPSGMTSHPKSIVHAHTHVLHDFVMHHKYLEMIQAKPLDDIKRAECTHYFAYKIGANGQRFCCFDDRVYVPRQYARQIIATELGYTPGQYNWRKFDFAENVHSTLYFIFRMLKSTKLSDRISNRTSCFKVGYAQREDFFEH